MNSYHANIIKNLETFIEKQLEHHKKVEDVDSQGISDKLIEIQKENQHISDNNISMDSLSKKIDIIITELETNLSSSFQSFQNYITQEIKGIKIDFSFMKDAKEQFISNFNLKIDNLIDSINETIDDPAKFKVFNKDTLNNVFLISFDSILEKIKDYNKFLKEKKEVIAKILQDLSAITVKINPFKNEKYKKFPSYKKIIQFEKQAEELASSEIKKLLKELEKDKEENNNNISEVEE